MRFQTRTLPSWKPIGRSGASATSTSPVSRRKSISRADLRMRATVLPAVRRTSSLLSSTLTAGACGVSTTAHEKSLGNVPFGATRTRNTPSRNTVKRTLALPLVSSRPSGSFSTFCTAPMCCQPCASSASGASHMKAAGSSERLNIPGIGSSGDFGLRRGSSHEPLFEERCSPRALHAAPHGIHYTAAQISAGAIETEPVRQVNFVRQALDFQLQGTHFEEAVLKNKPQHFFAQQLFGMIRRQPRHRAVSRCYEHRLSIARRSAEFE